MDALTAVTIVVAVAVGGLGYLVAELTRWKREHEHYHKGDEHAVKLNERVDAIRAKRDPGKPHRHFVGPNGPIGTCWVCSRDIDDPIHQRAGEGPPPEAA